MIPRKKRLVIPGLFWDGEQWSPAGKYPQFKVFTDTGLARLLNTSIKRVEMWRKANKIPFSMQGPYAVYNLNKVIQALLDAGYKQDMSLKSDDNN